MPNQGITITINAATADAAQKLQQFFSGVNQNLEKVGGMSSLLEELGGKLAAIFTVGALVEFTKEAINTAESLGKLQQKTGLALTTLTALREESQKLGTPFEELQVSLGMFSDKLFNAVKVGGPALQTFRELGIRLVDANGSLRSTDDVLANVAEKFKELPDGPQKAAAAMDLFGRSGRELIPILNQGSAGIEEMRQKGGPITAQMVQDATQFNRSLREVKESFELLFIGVAQRLLPTLKELVGVFRDLGNTGEGLDNDWSAALSIVAMEFSKVLTSGMISAAGFFGASMYVIAGEYGKRVDAIHVAVFNRLSAFISQHMRLFGIVKIPQFKLDPFDFDAATLEINQQMAEGAKILKSASDEFFDKGIAAAKSIVEASARTRDNFRKVIEFALQVPQTVMGAFGMAGASAVAGKAPVSDEAKKLIEQIDRAYAESTRSKVDLLNIEEKELKGKIDKEVLDVTLAEAKKTEVTEIYAAKRKLLVQKEEDSKREIQLAALQGRLQLLENDPNQTEADKKERLLVLMREENRLLEENIEINKRRVSDPQLSDEAHLAAEKQLTDLYSKEAELKQKIANTSAAGTFSGEFTTVLTQLRNVSEQTWRAVATSFKSVFDGAISSISSGITGLIMQTKTWGQALTEISTSILTSIVQGIVEIGVRWVLTNLLMAVAGKTIAASSTAALAPIAAAQAAIWAAPATLATIASYGGAAAAAPGLIAASEGITMASTLGSFDTGGFTGAGYSGQVAGVVHSNEVVFSAPAVRSAGAGKLEDLHQSLLGKGSPSGSSRPQQMVVSVSDDRRAQDLKRDPMFEGIVVDIFNKNRWRYGQY